MTTTADVSIAPPLESALRERLRGEVRFDLGSRAADAVDSSNYRQVVVGPEVELFVDANGGYLEFQASRVGRALDDLGIALVEEPVSSDDEAGLGTVRRAVLADVGAGGYGDSLDYFHDHVRIERLFFDGIRPVAEGELAASPEVRGTGLSFRPDRAEPYRAR